MQCPKCQKIVSENDNFCIYCSTPLKEIFPLSFDIQSNKVKQKSPIGITILGIILTFILIPIGSTLGLIFSFIGLNRAKRQQRAKALSTVGVILATTVIIICAIFMYVYIDELAYFLVHAVLLLT